MQMPPWPSCRAAGRASEQTRVKVEGRSMRLLVVEDEPRLARSLRNGLEEEGHAVDVALDGDDGVVLATTNEYDVIILDVLLPRRNGFAVCHEVRDRHVTTPILMLTARDSVADRVAGLNTGADD